MASNATTTAAAPVAPKPQRRQSTIDDARLKKLEEQLKQRPEHKELQDKNILKGVSS